MIKQHSKEWHEARLGRLTSSTIYKLMTKPKKAGELLSEGAKTYCIEKMVERVTGWKEEFSNAATEWGNTYEEQARRTLESFCKTVSMECGFIIHPYLKHFGGSPDGVIRIGDKDHCIEIKCPYAPKEHIYNVKACKDVETFKSMCPEYYWQLQANMLLTGCDMGLFMTYCPMPQLSVIRERILFIEPNEADQQLLNDKLIAAIDYMTLEANELGLTLDYSDNSSVMLAEYDNQTNATIIQSIK